jgi:pimeloyl-ACP methyl ester carboxylesterase
MTSSDTHIYYEHHGYGNPIILIHGIAASLRQWDVLVPDLVEAGFSTYALDLPGHGNSHKPKSGHYYHIEVLYVKLEDWIRNLQSKSNVIVIGHSMGGYLGLLYALRHPDKVESLVLSNPYYSPEQLSPLLRMALKKPTPDVKALRKVPSWIIDFILKISEKTNRSLPQNMQQQLASDFRRVDPAVLYTAQTTRDLTPLLPQINIPTLILWGSEDMTLSPASFNKMAAAIPSARAFAFSNGGHLSHIAQADTFNKQVLNFLNKHNPYHISHLDKRMKPDPGSG